MTIVSIFLVLFALLMNISFVNAGSDCADACWTYLIDDICDYDVDRACLCDFDKWRHFEQCVLVECMEKGRSGYMDPIQRCGFVMDERAPIETAPPSLLEKKDDTGSKVKRIFSLCPFIRGNPCLVAEQDPVVAIKDVTNEEEAKRIAVHRVHDLCPLAVGATCSLKLAYREVEDAALDEGVKKDVAASATSTEDPSATRSAVERIFSLCPFIRGNPCLVEVKYEDSSSRTAAPGATLTTPPGPVRTPHAYGPRVKRSSGHGI